MYWRRYGLGLGLAALAVSILLASTAGLSSSAQDNIDKTNQAAKDKKADKDKQTDKDKQAGKDKQPPGKDKQGGKGGKKGSATPVPEELLLADLKVSSDFKVTIFGRHPDVNYPTCICAATNGMVFVGCDGNSAQGTAADRGRVMRVMDADGDGKADSYVEFCKVDHPRGLLYLNGALYVCHPLHFSVFYDDDGDGKADRSEMLVKNVSSPKAVNARGGDHTTNNIVLGIDGWIYFAVGDMGMAEAVALKDGAKISMRGGIARIRPDGTGFEQVTWGQRNIYGIGIDPFMNMFTRDNNNDGGGWGVRFSNPIPTAHYGYPSLFTSFSDEVMPPLADYGGGGPTGAIFLDEPMFPAPYNNTLFTVDYGKNQIFRHVLEPQGASFKNNVKQIEFLRCTNPINLEFDGMGRLFVTSFRGAGFNFSGPNTGYVAQLVHKDVKPTAFPDLPKASDAELLKYLTGSSATVRLQAQREILRRGDKEYFATELEKAATSEGQLSGRVAALFTLKLLRGDKAYPALVRLAGNSTMREFALKALADDRKHASAATLALFVKGLKDADPRVRLQSVLGIGRLGNKANAEHLIPLLADPDRSIAHVAYRNLWILGAWEVCLQALDPGAPPAVVTGCTFALQSMHEPAVVDGLIQKLHEVKDARIQQAAIRALARLYFDEKPFDGPWWGTRPSTKGPYFQTVKWSQSEKIADALSKAVKIADTPSLAYLLQEVTKNNVPLASKVELTIKLATGDAKYRPQAVTLLAGQGQLAPDGADLLQQIVREGKDAAVVQAQAIKALHAAAVKAKNLDLVVPALATRWGASLPTQIALARDAFLLDGALADHVDYFVASSASSDAKQSGLAYAVLLQITTNFQLPSGPRNLAGKHLEAAWSKPGSAIALLKAIGDIKAEEFAIQVKQFQSDNRPEVKEAADYAAKLIDLDALAKAKTGPTVATIQYDDVMAAVLKEKGDSTRGSRLFIKQGCILCHTVSPLDTPKGPHLEDIGSKQKRDELLESILKPSAKLAQGYEPWQFTLQDGKTVTGFVVRESGDDIEIRNVGGISLVIAKTDIDTRVRGEISVMPEGLVSTLTVQELSSLVAYLESLQTKK